MRLLRLELKNFRGFEERSFALHPDFNLIIGENGAGKTSVLEGIAVALGGWLQAFGRADQRNIRKRDIRRIEQISGGRARDLLQLPVAVTAVAELDIAGRQGLGSPEIYTWTRTLVRDGGRTTGGGSKEVRAVSRSVAASVSTGAEVVLPVIRYFGAGRLWEAVRAAETKPRGKRHTPQMSEVIEAKEPKELSDPFYGYRMSIDKRASASDLLRWIGAERRNEVDLEDRSPALALVFDAILSLLPEFSRVRFELRRSMLILERPDGSTQPFEDMSDGYRNLIALAADLAIKMSMLNPHLGDRALAETPGIVLIDEIDLHLHPRWQRRISEDLRRAFPKVQFICTSHSPFIVQSLRSGEELIVLDGQPTADTANMTLEEVAEGLMGVDDAETGARYTSMKNTARELFEEMDRSDLSTQERFETFQRHLAEATAPYADNPAYQALLEFELAAKAPRTDG
jgi:predicted ATP-binding protein involved in virulence